ncbi:MAG: class I SAM-dependent methyltransferase [Anaerolineae bacterium]|nr:class I SAM-dependent methyltransferase [Anaerolineae bacterium]
MTDSRAIPLAEERFDVYNLDYHVSTRLHHVGRYKYAATYCGHSWLDVCCGQGYGTAILKEAHPSSYVMGIDKEAEVLWKAREEYKSCDFLVADVIQRPFTKQFDIITFFEALEHFSFDQGKAVLSWLKDVLAPGGTLILSTPEDIRADHNPFHISEWTIEALQGVLESLFSSLKIYGQTWETGKIGPLEEVKSDFYICVCGG